MDTVHQWPPQEIVVKPMEEIVPSTCTKPAAANHLERRPRPQKEQALNCPRCNSTNTKFCYYNNYSLTQPRYFCKTCRRYWTEGGSLRNIPVGGGSRKNKRSSSSSSSSSAHNNNSSSSSDSSKKLPDDLVLPPSSSQCPGQNPKINPDRGQDLNLGFPATQDFRRFSEFLQVPHIDHGGNKTHMIASTSASSQLSALELITGITSRGLNSFMPVPVPDPNAVYSNGSFGLQEFKPTINFSLEGIGSTGYGVQENSGRLLFPFEDLKQVSSNTDVEQNKDQGDSTGYWSGMIGGGSW